jgi:hypothetical protein
MKSGREKGGKCKRKRKKGERHFFDLDVYEANATSKVSL